MAELNGTHLLGATLAQRYRLDALVGSGAMGFVYRGVDLQTESTIAAKVLRHHLLGSLSHIRRFQREAELIRRLRHKNIIEIRDAGQTDAGEPYLITELLEGQTLADLLAAEGRLSPERATRLTTELLKALAEAHGHGIIHRDIKPENLFILSPPPHVDGAAEDHVKILDFGVAKLITSDAATSETVDGALTGTPAYLSPEQGLGRPLDNRSDLYSVGVVLYQLVTGRLPFPWDDPRLVVHAHRNDPVPPLDVYPPLPRAFERCIYRCLAKHPNDRPESAEALIAMLERSLTADVSTERLTFRETPTLEAAALWDTVTAGFAVPAAPNPTTTAQPADPRRPSTDTDAVPAPMPPSEAAQAARALPRRHALPSAVPVGAAAASLLIFLALVEPWAGSTAEPAPPIQSTEERTPQPRKVSLTSTPPRAQVTGDQGLRGRTPLTIDVHPSRPIRLTLSASGYQPTVLTLEANRPTVHVILKSSR